ncbi:MAG: diguanylate cyclase [Sulfuricellaceae bacterium]|nr:diguanylate cyclase [Sulfuricellaceae bacterium]
MILRALFSLLSMLWSVLAMAAPISLVQGEEAAVGLHAYYLKEQGARLELAQVVASDQAGAFVPGGHSVLSFGVGAKPVWIRFSVRNTTGAPVSRRVSIENAWLDHVEIYVQHQGKTVTRHDLGDSKPFAARPLKHRFFTFDQLFDTGLSEVYLRVETPDPMVVPIYLASADESRIRDVLQEYSYGFVYGFLLALLAYNAMLFANLRSWRYFYYSLYLAAFVAMNFAYTGHAYAWFWPEAVKWQQWSNPILIFLYSVSGLLFATRFLETRKNFPGIHQTVWRLITLFGILLTIAIGLGSHLHALLVSFAFVFLFSNIMWFLGVKAVLSGQSAARYFLMASIVAMAGALLTTFSVWGFIPFNSWTYRAAEIGILGEATLLALALAYQFRIAEEEKNRAEALAQLDPLTSLNNRRAFYDKTASLWSVALRNERDTAVMLIDIDLFKRINDTLGHAHGDQVLVALADTLKASIRQGDVLARWGGEEFIVFLPETSPDEANILAERLRTEIASIQVPHASGVTTFTASFGLAQRTDEHATLDSLIASADRLLYQSKQHGRNRVTCSFSGGYQNA